MGVAKRNLSKCSDLNICEIDDGCEGNTGCFVGAGFRSGVKRTVVA